MYNTSLRANRNWCGQLVVPISRSIVPLLVPRSPLPDDTRSTFSGNCRKLPQRHTNQLRILCKGNGLSRGYRSISLVALLHDAPHSHYDIVARARPLISVFNHGHECKTLCYNRVRASLSSARVVFVRLAAGNCENYGHIVHAHYHLKEVFFVLRETWSCATSTMNSYKRAV